MSEEDARRIVRARALMWDAASGDEQAKWLRRVDEIDSQMVASFHCAVAGATEEHEGRPALRIVP